MLVFRGFSAIQVPQFNVFVGVDLGEKWWISTVFFSKVVSTGGEKYGLFYTGD